MDITSRTLSPRGLKIFYLIAFPLLGEISYQLYTDSGLVAWMNEQVVALFGSGRKTKKLAYVIWLIPIMAIASVPAYLHDYVCKLSLFAPPQPKPKRPHDPLRDW